jgi:DNA polymerase III sliding clamp (beta) subunit (PCNA family)
VKLPNKINPMHCASKDSTRYVLNGVRIQGNLAVAVDGRTLFAAVGSRDEEDDARDALIPARAAKAAWPQSKGKRGCLLPMLTINPREEGANVPGTVTVTDREFDRTTIKEIDGNFPRFEAALPDVSKHTLRVGLNVKLLLNIAKCYGHDEMFLHFNREEERGGCLSEAIIVTNSKSPDAVAILMPLRNPNDLTGNRALDAMMKLRAVYDEEQRAKSEAATQAPAIQ